MSAQIQEALNKALEGKPFSDSPVKEDEFLSLEDLVPVIRGAAERDLKRILSEVEELITENKWEDVLSIFHPVSEKHPELVEHKMDIKVRAKIAFALGQLNRFDEAIEELSICVKQEPTHFLFHSSLAFTAYNSLFAAANREIFLSGQARRDRIALAHRHFLRAQECRPGGITNFYREGMLYRKIERNTEKGLPLFERAVSNWDHLDDDDKKARHQEHKNFAKALYQMASSLLKKGMSKRALEVIKRCLSEDERTNHVSLLFKYFALGKVHFQLNNFSEARDALVFATKCEASGAKDFVYELLGRTYLAMRAPSRALEVISKIPEKARRPYYCWTEADILCALKEFSKARAVLTRAQERDNRSKHKTLIRLAKIEYVTGDFTQAMKYAAAADQFFHDNWGNRFYEGIFWQAICAFRLGDHEKSTELALTLRDLSPHYPKLNILMKKLSQAR